MWHASGVAEAYIRLGGEAWGKDVEDSGIDGSIIFKWNFHQFSRNAITDVNYDKIEYF
jgi:hypothetical protein